MGRRDGVDPDRAVSEIDAATGFFPIAKARRVRALGLGLIFLMVFSRFWQHAPACGVLQALFLFSRIILCHGGYF